VDPESDMASSMHVSLLSRGLPIRQTSIGTTTLCSATGRMVYHPLQARYGPYGVLYGALQTRMLLL
jgi:hypothetical protein